MKSHSLFEILLGFSIHFFFQEKVELLRKADDYDTLLARHESILAENQRLQKENDELRTILLQQQQQQQQQQREQR